MKFGNGDTVRVITDNNYYGYYMVVGYLGRKLYVVCNISGKLKDSIIVEENNISLCTKRDEYISQDEIDNAVRRLNRRMAGEESV